MLIAPVRFNVVLVPNSMKVARLQLEVGTLAIVRDGHLTDALVTNLTG